MTIKKIISGLAAATIAFSAIASMTAMSASAADTCVFETKEDVKVACGSYYTGNCKFLTNNTAPEDGNPFEDQYQATEANGKYYTVEVTLNSITAGTDNPDPTEITMCIVAQSETASWEDTVNGYPTFKGIGSTIKLSTMKLPDDFSITTDEYYQFTVQLGLTDESSAKINGVKGTSYFNADISIKAYVSDEPTLNPVYSGTGAAAATEDGTTATPTSSTSADGKTTANANTGAVGFVAIPVALSVAGIVASKKKR